MPFTAYLYVKAKSGGVIEGETGEKDVTKAPLAQSVQNMSRIHQIDHVISVPPHPQTGQPQGTAKHEPFCVWIEPDKSVPQLYEAMALNKEIEVVHVFFFGSGRPADEKFHNWFTTTLSTVRVVGMEMHKASSAAAEKDIPLIDTLVKVTFSYQKIAWEELDSKKESEFDWNQKAG